MTYTPKQILSKMEELFPNAKSELVNWSTPFQFLICIVLSAQTTDKGVNKVTPELFKKFANPVLMSKAKVTEIEEIIRTVNYHRNKSRFIIELSKKVVEEFDGKVPGTVEELVTLPGVGNKTANVFLNDLYKKNEGIGVDTHVARVARRLGLTKNKNPDKISRDLENIFPKSQWWKINTYFVLYGRYICRANMSKTRCVFRDMCSYCNKLPLE